MSDLADRIEADYKLIGSNGWQPIYDEVMDNLPAIIKALRFAEDMQVLGEVMFFQFIDNESHEQWQIQFRYQNEILSVFGRDHYEAARKAAEQLGKGET